MLASEKVLMEASVFSFQHLCPNVKCQCWGKLEISKTADFSYQEVFVYPLSGTSPVFERSKVISWQSLFSRPPLS